MKKIYTVLALLFTAIACSAQVTVTLLVDMQNEIVAAEGVHVAGSFQGWNPASTEMSDADMDGVYEYSFTTNTAATYEFRFLNGNFWGMEEYIPGPCAVNNNRAISVDPAAGDVSYAVCYGECAACGEITIQFRVDMSQEAAISPNGVHIAGDFQGWIPGDTEMTDEDGDLVYTYTTTVDSAGTGGVIAYRYINGNAWTDPHEYLVGAECADVSGNRVLEITESTIVTGVAETGAPHCFRSCGSCVAPSLVAFRVDMTNEAVSGDGVYLMGSFTSPAWESGAVMMSDDNLDFVYEATVNISGPAEIFYKFVNGAPSGQEAIEESGVLVVDDDSTNFEFAGCGVSNSFGEFSRKHTRSGEAEVLEAVCWNSCSICSEGCMDVDACNFDPSASIETNELCTYPGCGDPEAVNFDPIAGCDGNCLYLTYDCASIGDVAWASATMGVFPDWQIAVYGVDWSSDWVFNVPASVIEPSSGATFNVHHIGGLTVSEVPDWMGIQPLTGSLLPSTQYCIPASGLPNEVGIHTLAFSGEVFISIFGQPFSIGMQSFSAVLEVAENPNPIPGCTYATAMNFSGIATIDDGSCQFVGCTDSTAVNFTALATVDDGSCIGDCNGGPTSSCASDSNGDGAVTVSDLLILLGEFGVDCL